MSMHILTDLLVTAYWIAFGPHGPRAKYPKHDNVWIAKWVFASLVLSTVIFFSIRAFARPPPKTLNEQWQKMTNEYLRVSCCYFKHTHTSPYVDVNFLVDCKVLTLTLR